MSLVRVARGGGTVAAALGVSASPLAGAQTGEFTLWNGTCFNFETLLQVRLCVCMRACVRVCVHTYVRACLRACVRARVCVCLYGVRACIRACVHARCWAG